MAAPPCVSVPSPEGPLVHHLVAPRVVHVVVEADGGLVEPVWQVLLVRLEECGSLSHVRGLMGWKVGRYTAVPVYLDCSTA